MKNQRERDLLIDIAKLLRKYGPESFEALAETISSPEMAQQLTIILTEVAKITRTIPKTKRGVRPKEMSPVPRSLIALKSVEPETYKLLMNFYNDLIGKTILPTLRDIKEFGVDCGLLEIRAKSRQKAISPLISMLIKLPREKLTEKIQSVKKYEPSERSLEGWSNIILNKEQKLSMER